MGRERKRRKNGSRRVLSDDDNILIDFERGGRRGGEGGEGEEIVSLSLSGRRFQ